MREPGRASGTLALKLGGTNDVDFAEEATEYSVADIVWTLDASAQYDFWATDDVATYSTYEIKQAAEAISAHGATADVPAFRQYDRYLKQDQSFSMKWNTGSVSQARVLGLRQDTRTAGGYAGITFALNDAFGLMTWGMNAGTSSYGNGNIKPWLEQSFYSAMPPSLQKEIAGVTKSHRCYSGGSGEIGTATRRETTINEKSLRQALTR